MLLLLKENLLDELKLEDIKPFTIQFVSFVKEMYKTVYNEIKDTQELSDKTIETIKTIAHEFNKTFQKN